MDTLRHAYVDLDDPDNIRYTPDDAEGNPGKITYVFVPSPMLPLVEMTGLLAPLLNPILDPILRPIVESAYQRPFDVPAPVASAASPAPVASVASTPTCGSGGTTDRSTTRTLS